MIKGEFWYFKTWAVCFALVRHKSCLARCEFLQEDSGGAVRFGDRSFKFTERDYQQNFIYKVTAQYLADSKSLDEQTSGRFPCETSVPPGKQRGFYSDRTLGVVISA